MPGENMEGRREGIIDYYKTKWIGESREQIQKMKEKAFDKASRREPDGKFKQGRRNQESIYSEASAERKQDIDFAERAIEQHVVMMEESAEKIIQEMEAEVNKPDADLNEIDNIDKRFNLLTSEMGTLFQVLLDVGNNEFKLEEQGDGSMRIKGQEIALLAGQANEEKFEPVGAEQK